MRHVAAQVHINKGFKSNSWLQFITVTYLVSYAPSPFHTIWIDGVAVEVMLVACAQLNLGLIKCLREIHCVFSGTARNGIGFLREQFMTVVI